MKDLINEERLENVVRASLGCFTPLVPEEIDIISNTSKYALNGNTADTDIAALDDIFGYMAQLNEIAVSNNSLCAGRLGISLRDNLCQAANYIAEYSNGAPVRYIEIGPEPHKTSLVLEQLMQNNVNLGCYIGVDINPKSETTMRLALEPLIGVQRFNYTIIDYNDCNADYFGHHEGVTVITMLGFEEGNELPEKMARILEQLTRPGNLLLSEMQLFSEAGWGQSPTFIIWRRCDSFLNAYVSATDWRPPTRTASF